MKIELECGHCKALLRLDREHAGKQFRCPACGELSVVPTGHGAIEPMTEGTGSAETSSARPGEPAHSRDWTRTVPEPVYRRPASLREFPVDPVSTGGTIGFAVSSVACGILGILFAFTCACISPIIANVGIVLAFHARGSGLWTGVLVNITALLVWASVSVLSLFSNFW